MGVVAISTTLTPTLSRKSGRGGVPPRSFQRTFGRVGVGIVGEDAVDDLGLVFAIGALSDLHEVEVWIG
jgi:hypothetical protein